MAAVSPKLTVLQASGETPLAIMPTPLLTPPATAGSPFPPSAPINPAISSRAGVHINARTISTLNGRQWKGNARWHEWDDREQVLKTNQELRAEFEKIDDWLDKPNFETLVDLTFPADTREDLKARTRANQMEERMSYQWAASGSNPPQGVRRDPSSNPQAVIGRIRSHGKARNDPYRTNF